MTPRRTEAVAVVMALLGRPEAEREAGEIVDAVLECFESGHGHNPSPEIAPPSPAAAIRFRMEQAGYTRADLVRIVGTRARAAEILAGKREPSKAHTRRLADEWGIPARSLLGDAAGTR